MENKQETTKTKNITQKAKKIRSMIMMTLLCVLMMSAATYAWFTLSNTAKVSNLTMTVGDVSGLQIAEDENGAEPADDKWKGATDPVEFKGTLLPATTTDGINILKPKYEDGNVSDVEETGDNDKLTKESSDSSQGYYVEYSFWLRASGADGQKTTVKLDDGENTNNGIFSNTGNHGGTYSLSTGSGTNNILPSAAVRISLINGSDAKIYEPNSDFQDPAKIYAQDTRQSKGTKESDVKQKIEGTFESADSSVLTLDNNKATRIILKLWLEGTDDQCGNEIAAKKIITQLKFSTVNGGESTP